MYKDSSKNIIKLLKEGDDSTLEKIYLDNRVNFIKFARKYNVDKHKALDIYQDAIIILRENAIEGKIHNLKSNITTYLFAIGKYHLFQEHRKNSKVDFDNEIVLEEEITYLDVNLFDKNLTNQQKLLNMHLPNLGKRCREILTLFYYEGYTLDEITEILDYSNKKVLKSQKSRCLKQIKEMIKKQL